MMESHGPFDHIRSLHRVSLIKINLKWPEFLSHLSHPRVSLSSMTQLHSAFINFICCMAIHWNGFTNSLRAQHRYTHLQSQLLGRLIQENRLGPGTQSQPGQLSWDTFLKRKEEALSFLDPVLSGNPISMTFKMCAVSPPLLPPATPKIPATAAANLHAYPPACSHSSQDSLKNQIICSPQLKVLSGSPKLLIATGKSSSA